MAGKATRYVYTIHHNSLKTPPSGESTQVYPARIRKNHWNCYCEEKGTEGKGEKRDREKKSDRYIMPKAVMDESPCHAYFQGVEP